MTELFEMILVTLACPLLLPLVIDKQEETEREKES